MPNNFFLTGYRGAGKTTMIKRVIRELQLRPAGFVTIKKVSRSGGTAFYLYPAERWIGKAEGQEADLDPAYQSKACFAVRDSNQALWHVDERVFDQYGVSLLHRSPGSAMTGTAPSAGLSKQGVSGRDIMILDELGRFEIKAIRFQERVFEVLRARGPVLGVLKYEQNNFLQRVHNYPGVEVIWVEKTDWEACYRTVLNRLQKVV